MVRRLLKFLVKEFNEKNKEFRELDLGFKLINRLGSDLPELIDKGVIYLEELTEILLEDLELYTETFGNRNRIEEEAEFVLKQCVYIIKSLCKTYRKDHFWKFLELSAKIIKSTSLEIIFAFQFLFLNFFSAEFHQNYVISNTRLLEWNDRVGDIISQDIKEKFANFIHENENRIKENNESQKLNSATPTRCTLSINQ